MTIKVSCGLYAEDSLFPPFANVSGDYVTDLNLALETYNSITAQSFDKKEVLLARLKVIKLITKQFFVPKCQYLFMRICV